MINRTTAGTTRRARPGDRRPGQPRKRRPGSTICVQFCTRAQAVEVATSLWYVGHWAERSGRTIRTTASLDALNEVARVNGIRRASLYFPTAASSPTQEIF